MTRLIDSESRTIEHLRARLTTLGPAATLARGYAVVQRVVADGDPEVLRSVEDAPPGTQIPSSTCRRRRSRRSDGKRKMSNATDTDINELGYEAARDELVSVVKILEQGGLDLDASLSLWERGEALAKRW